MWMNGKSAYLMLTLQSALEGYAPWTMSIITDVNGGITNAILSPRISGDGLRITHGGLADGNYAFEVRGDLEPSAHRSPKQGVLIGEIGNLTPRLFAHYNTRATTYSWRIGKTWLERISAPEFEHTYFPLDGGPSFVATSPSLDVDGLKAPYSHFLGGDAFLEVSSLRKADVMIVDATGAARELLRDDHADRAEDTAMGAMNFGTDGTDMVWTRGEAHPDHDDVYPVRSIMTAPFTRDAVRVKPRRLRSDPNAAQHVNYAVGCGYAAHPESSGHGLLIVRLSDGRSWTLPGNTRDWIWNQALGVTCDEVFATFARCPDGDGPECSSNVARIKLDTLGGGDPAD